MYSDLINKINAWEIIINDPNEHTRNLVKSENKVLNLNDVIIFKKYGLIADANRKIIPETTNEHIFWQPKIINYNKLDVDERLKFFQEEINNGNIKKTIQLNSEIDFIYLCHPFEWYAYGHLFDTLQRLYQLSNRNFVGPFLICSDYSRITDFRTHIEMLGYRSDLIIPFYGFFDAIYVNKLVYSESPANITQFTNDTRDWIWRRYIANNHNLKIQMQDYILFLDRSGVGTRDIINKNELLDFLSKRFEIKIFTGSEKVDEMLNIFNKAKYVLGVHGAMFVNTIFCSPETKIIELIPSTRVVVNMLQMNKFAKNHVGLILEANNEHAINVDPKLILKMLNKENG